MVLNLDYLVNILTSLGFFVVLKDDVPEDVAKILETIQETKRRSFMSQ